MGVLSSIGKTSIPVFKKLKIGILITGDEIVTPYETPKVGQVRDVNSYLLEGLIRSANCEPVIYNIKSDIFEEIYGAAEKAVTECDIVLVSGGSSVGVKDFTKKVFQKLPAAEILFHGLALKPGKPTLVAQSGRKMLFGMPGHPLACAVVFKTLVKYYMDLVTCYKEKEYPVVCKLVSDYKKTKGREEYIPVSIEEREEEFLATPIVGKSGIISTFSKAYGYFRTDKECNEVNAGDIVAVYKL
jgi:molybdopterin molybdotransferase